MYLVAVCRWPLPLDALAGGARELIVLSALSSQSSRERDR